jgi:hypothetical protein
MVGPSCLKAVGQGVWGVPCGAVETTLPTRLVYPRSSKEGHPRASKLSSWRSLIWRQIRWWLQ